MNDWTKTNYGTPRSWDEIQREKREAGYDRDIQHGPGEPLMPLMWKLVIVATITATSFGTLLYLIFQ
ncbi:MAG: hypothetical protein ACN6O2_07120 [Stenotrophomonas sp.]